MCALFGYLRLENLSAMPNSDFFCGRNTFFVSFFLSLFSKTQPNYWTDTYFFGSRHYAAVLFSQVPNKCTDLDLSIFYILISGTYSKFARKNNLLAPSVWEYSVYWKLIVDISGMRKLLYSPWQTLSIPFALTTVGQLHQSPPSPVPIEQLT